MRYGGHITLVEHRRCVPEIIGFSNRIAYEPDGVRLIPVRQYGADRLEPIKAVHVADGYERGTTAKVNPAEVDAIVDQIEKCLADPRYDGLTFGVISLLGTAQAKAIEAALLERIPPEEWTARDLRCGDAADFQGSERDVMFLSMVAAAEPRPATRRAHRRTSTSSATTSPRRAPRTSCGCSTPSHSETSATPKTCASPCSTTATASSTAPRSKTTASSPPPCPRTCGSSPFDSLFEQRVFNRLYDRGYSVIPQFPAEGYSIDLVVVGSKGRLPSSATATPGTARSLRSATSPASATWNAAAGSSSASASPSSTSTRPRLSRGCGETLARARHPPVGMDGRRNGRRRRTQAGRHRRVPPRTRCAGRLDENVTIEEPLDTAPLLRTFPPSVAALTGHPAEPSLVEEPPVELDPSMPQTASTLQSYMEFIGSVTTPVSASRQELLDGIVAIVAVEGPVDGYRLHTAYVKAAGGHRVGKTIAKILNSAITSAVRQGQLVVDNPLNEAGVKPRTYRLPDQPEVRPRTLGPRPSNRFPRVSLIPDGRSSAAARLGQQGTLYRTVLGRLGLHRLTANVEARLERALQLAELTHEADIRVD